jgi:glycosyltransferase involved in cell wall biosynthesis
LVAGPRTVYLAWDMPRVLSVHPSLCEVDAWAEKTTSILAIDQDWNKRSLLRRLFTLTRNLRAFDTVMINRDVRLAALLLIVKFFGGTKTRVVFHEFYFDESQRRGFRSWLGFALHWLVARLSDSVVVHASAEVELYSQQFGVPRERFTFLRYFAYEDAQGWEPRERRKTGDYVLAVGRHRDFVCFVNAVSRLSIDAVIVAGESDRAQIEKCPAHNVEVLYEVSFERYRDLLYGATIVVLPLRHDTWLRSLGQIALLEAALMKKPVVAADSFHLRDYAPDGSVARYRAGDPASLRDAIERVLLDIDYRTEIAARLHEYVKRTCTMQQYLDGLWTTCLSPKR